MSKYNLYVDVLKNDLLKGNENKKSLKFFRNTHISVLVWFTLIDGFYKNIEVNLEFLVDEVNKLTKVSRPTIVKIIDNAISNKLVIKSKSTKDSRMVLFTPSTLTIKEFEEWSDNFFNLKY